MSSPSKPQRRFETRSRGYPHSVSFACWLTPKRHFGPGWHSEVLCWAGSRSIRRCESSAILRVAAIAGCDYEFVQHEPIAIGVGADPKQVAALAAGRAEGPEFDPRETLVLRFVGEVLDNKGTAGALVEELEEALSARGVVELLLVISQYHGLALLLNTTAVEPDPPAAMAVVEAAQGERDLRS